MWLFSKRLRYGDFDLGVYCKREITAATLVLKPPEYAVSTCIVSSQRWSIVHYIWQQFNISRYKRKSVSHKHWKTNFGVPYCLHKEKKFTRIYIIENNSWEVQVSGLLKNGILFSDTLQMKHNLHLNISFLFCLMIVD